MPSDPFSSKFRERAHNRGAWVHVGRRVWFMGHDDSLHRKPRRRAVRAADSWATDFHKWLNVPYDSGIAIVREREALRAAMAITAEYLPTSEFRNPSDFTPELSRRARRGGLGGTASAGPGRCRRVRRAQLPSGETICRKDSAAGFKVLNEVVLNQVLVVASATRKPRLV